MPQNRRPWPMLGPQPSRARSPLRDPGHPPRDQGGRGRLRPPPPCALTPLSGQYSDGRPCAGCGGPPRNRELLPRPSPMRVALAATPIRQPHRRANQAVGARRRGRLRPCRWSSPRLPLPLPLPLPLRLRLRLCLRRHPSLWPRPGRCRRPRLRPHLGLRLRLRPHLGLRLGRRPGPGPRPGLRQHLCPRPRPRPRRPTRPPPCPRPHPRPPPRPHPRPRPSPPPGRARTSPGSSSLRRAVPCSVQRQHASRHWGLGLRCPRPAGPSSRAGCPSPAIRKPPRGARYGRGRHLRGTTLPPHPPYRPHPPRPPSRAITPPVVRCAPRRRKAIRWRSGRRAPGWPRSGCAVPKGTPRRPRLQRPHAADAL